MSLTDKKYSLDANALIQAWQKYYPRDFCPGYWDALDSLGAQQRIFVAEEVYSEIVRTEDDLCVWLKASRIPVHKISEDVTKCLKQIYDTDPSHRLLVDSTKGRSLADPWVIAHAMSAKGVVVTKEEKVTAVNSNRIKIPNVCDNMGIKWINDFDFIREVGLVFECKLPK